MELRLEKTKGVFLHIYGQWHVVEEINVDYDPSMKRGKVEIKYQNRKGDRKYSFDVNAPSNLIDDLKAFGLSDVKESAFLIRLESNRKFSWRITTNEEIERNPEFAQIYTH